MLQHSFYLRTRTWGSSGQYHLGGCQSLRNRGRLLFAPHSDRNIVPIPLPSRNSTAEICSYDTSCKTKRLNVQTPTPVHHLSELVNNPPNQSPGSLKPNPLPLPPPLLRPRILSPIPSNHNPPTQPPLALKAQRPPPRPHRPHRLRPPRQHRPASTRRLHRPDRYLQLRSCILPPCSHHFIYRPVYCRRITGSHKRDCRHRPQQSWQLRSRGGG